MSDGDSTPSNAAPLDAAATFALVAALVVEGIARAEQEPPRIGLRLEEAARAVGVSDEFFRRNVAPELRIVRIGRVKIVAVAELHRWLDRHASYALDTRRVR